MTENDLVVNFNTVCAVSSLSWDIESKLKRFLKRFWKDPYSESEKAWMISFCADKKINAKARFQQIREYIHKQ